MSEIFPNMLIRSAEQYPNKTAIVYNSREISFADLQKYSEQAARRLASAGAGLRTHTAILAQNSAAYAIITHALALLRSVMAPLNTRLSREECLWQMRDCEANILICDEAFAETGKFLAEQLPEARVLFLPSSQTESDLFADLPEKAVEFYSEYDADAIQAIMYTSGSSGKPKGALITYGMHWWNAAASALNIGAYPEDAWLANLPFFHIGGLSILMRSVIYGMRVIIHDKFDPVAANKAIAEDRATIISVVAVTLQKMLNALPDDSLFPPWLRVVLLGGGPAPESLLRECLRRGAPVCQTYGLTESCSQAVTLAPQDTLRKIGSAGRPLPAVQLKILRDGKETAAHEAGEIYLKGPTITKGYYHLTDLNTSVFQNGWFATGDIGSRDEEGYIYIHDRRADLIISGGENIYPAEIEAVLTGHPDVADAGVCGIDDEQWGKVPAALIKLRQGSQLTAQELREYAAQRLAKFKCPRKIVFTDDVPRNAAGKLMRRRFIELLQP